MRPTLAVRLVMKQHGRVSYRIFTNRRSFGHTVKCYAGQDDQGLVQDIKNTLDQLGQAHRIVYNTHVAKKSLTKAWGPRDSIIVHILEN